ncbi:GntR family transcriptional regulator [Streptomyces microflavus]|uniref:GntR family transcriptional regulator n=1 Tax=Streptomyces microflavus TaxID=1919 RepID=UPI00365F1513
MAARLLDYIWEDGAKPGDRLLSERALVARYGVPRVTMRAALSELAARDVVPRHQPAAGS